MTKIILVHGPSNTGKTKSIRKFLETRGIFHLKGGDITAVIPIQKNRQPYVLGIASGGDSYAIVRRNLNFLKKYNCDVIVCASRSYGQTYQCVSNFVQQARAQFVPIPTHRAVGRINAAINNIAIQIEQNI